MTRRRALALPAIALLALAGCSTGSDSPPMNQGSGSAPAASTPAPTTPAPTTPAPTQAAPTTAAPPSGPPTDLAAATAVVDAAAMVEGVRFLSPTGNIYCDLTSDRVVGCEIDEGGIDDPAYCGGGDGSSVVGRIESDGNGGFARVCNSDTIRLDGAPTLAYGQAVSGAGVRCAIEEYGAVCVTSTHGFVLGRDRQDLF